ncbi:hypothetical protein [Polyangium sorediatum]|uniref:Uncharacterized protein n=1 Tax=Polyangium sorediatum TaxID=889274 RepID=A0ABT6P901_9BACT|nr:hypothetical protein [Polyangium sorediatum]MDI1437095.1 hypothetical protein [Polyangium sorediatum]
MSNVLDILRESDEQGETASPFDEEVDEPDTAGPDDEDDDTAAVELAAEEGDTGDIRALRKRGKKQVSLEELRQIQMRSRARGQRVGAKKAQKVHVQKAKPKPKLPPNFVPPNSGARELFNKWTARDAKFVMRQDGHYYSVVEIPCKCQGTEKLAWLHIAKGDYTLFNVAVGESMTFLGNNATATTNWTNLQRPSKNTYSDQEFLIQSITMQEAGLRVRYDGSEIDKITGVGEAKGVLTGQAWLWDDAGTFLPKEIFHDFSGENLLYRTVRRSAVVYFNWDKARTGGNATSRKVLIDHLRNVPDTKVRTLSRTSGGAAVLPVSDGYVFTDNPERSEHGAFSAIIHIPEDIVFPIKPIDLGGGTPIRPIEVGLYVQLSLNGIAFEHHKGSNVTV